MEEENLEKDMTPVLLEDLGMRYPTENSKQKRRYGLYQCQYCGKEWVTNTPDIKANKIQSCGCHSENIKHKLRGHPIYCVWNSMKYRCVNPSSKVYKDYGARGIKICERWLDVKNFIEDMYPSYQEGLTLDRIDVNGDYEPDNCRWANLSTQQRNTRDICKTNTSGYRGVSLDKKNKKWLSQVWVNDKKVHIGRFPTALEAAKAYERYVRLNNLEHNFTPALTPEEIEALYEKES